MNVIARQRVMTLVDFLAWEAQQEFKHEFDGFGPIAMTGGSRNHAAIQQALALAMGNRLRAHPCDFFGSDLKIVTGSRVRYPDGQVVCEEGADGEATFTTTPTVVFEVASPSSVDLDHRVKAQEYRRIATVQRYVILEQAEVRATVHARSSNRWTIGRVGPGEAVVFPELGFDVPIAEFYEGWRFGRSE